jgi:hypothetical protein
LVTKFIFRIFEAYSGKEDTKAWSFNGLLMVYLDFEFEPGEEFTDRKSQDWISLYVDMLPPVGHNLSLARFQRLSQVFLRSRT